MLKGGLYVITDRQLGANLIPAVEAALQGGTRIVQYRDKSTDHRQRQHEAQQLLTLCHRYQSLLLINDDVELAAHIGADGVHLGRGDGSIAQARQRLGDSAIIGATCHNSLEFAQQAVSEGANYIAFGAMYPSSSKPQAQRAELSTLQQARQQFPCPIVAIGGITLHNAPPVIAAGADYVAVISDIFARPLAEISAHCQQFHSLFARTS